MHQAMIDGKMVHFTDQTVFQVQVGRGSKGAYKPRYTLKGNAVQACFYYRGINIGNGYKKRLVRIDTGVVLVRECS